MSISRRLIAGLLCTFALSTSVYAKSYPDVPVNHRHSTAIVFMTDRGTVAGYPNGEFHPDGLINRAEAVKIMTKSLYAGPIIDQALRRHMEAGHTFVVFPDVPIREWFGQFVEVAYQNKIVEGYPDGSFKPANNINFAEALKVILESYKVDFSQNRYVTNKFLVVPQGEWYEKYFTYASQHNLINREKVYHPAQLITRGEFVEIIYRLEEVLKTRASEFVVKNKGTSDEYKITIPKLNIVDVDVNFASVYDPNSALGILKYGLGHYLNPPDFGGKMVIFGHSSGYAWDHSNYKTILKEINKLSNGDRIYINYKEKGYVYEIFNSSIIPASQAHKLVEDDHLDELALYTCWPPNSIAQRYVVYGKPV